MSMNILGQTTQPALQPMVVYIIITTVTTVVATVAGLRILATRFAFIDLFFSSERTKKERGVACNYNNNAIEGVMRELSAISKSQQETSRVLDQTATVINNLAETTTSLVSSTNQLVERANMEDEIERRVDLKVDRIIRKQNKT